MLKEIAMKKILLITVVTSLIGVTGCSNKTIAEDKAKKIALNDAEVSEANITFTIQGKIKMDITICLKMIITLMNMKLIFMMEQLRIKKS